MLAVLFCISPSKVNKRATVATLKFAVQAGMVKVKPVKEAVYTDWPLLVKGLKEMIEALNGDIDDREKTIRDQEEEIKRLMADRDGNKGSADGSETSSNQAAGRKKRRHMRERSVLPTALVTMLGDAQDDVEKEADDEFDEKDRADVDEDEIDKEISNEIEYARGEKEAVAAVLSIEKEERIRKSTIFQGSAPCRESMLRDSTLARESHKLSLPNNAAAAQDVKAAAAFVNPSNDVFNTERINVNMGVDYEKDHMDTDNMDRDMLVERTEVLESMLEAEKALNESYLYSQQVIIDHLAETNEGLLQFFRVKVKVLGTGTSPKTPKKKKKKKKKIEENFKD